MRVKLNIRKGYIEVIRTPSDPRFSGVKNAKGESRLLYHLKLFLNTYCGLDMVKKRMWRDGHLVSEQQQYLRTRSLRVGWPHISIFNDQWAIEGAEQAFNRDGKVILRVVNNITSGEK